MLEDALEGEGSKGITLGKVELVHELDPVETETVEEGGEGLHAEENGEGDATPGSKADKVEDKVARREAAEEELLVEDDAELGVGEGECPETQVRGGVGDAAEDELDAVDGVVDEGVGERELLLVVVAARLGAVGVGRGGRGRGAGSSDGSSAVVAVVHERGAHHDLVVLVLLRKDGRALAAATAVARGVLALVVDVLDDGLGDGGRGPRRRR